jgi:hypothetical protein
MRSFCYVFLIRLTKYSLLAALLFLCLALPGCTSGSDTLTPPEYPVYLNDPANGYMQSISGNGLTVTLKFLPPPYLAARSLQAGTGQVRADSLTAAYAGSLSFQLEVTPAEDTVNLQQLIHSLSLA